MAALLLVTPCPRVWPRLPLCVRRPHGTASSARCSLLSGPVRLTPRPTQLVSADQGVGQATHGDAAMSDVVLLAAPTALATRLLPVLQSAAGLGEVQHVTCEDLASGPLPVTEPASVVAGVYVPTPTAPPRVGPSADEASGVLRALFGSGAGQVVLVSSAELYGASPRNPGFVDESRREGVAAQAGDAQRGGWQTGWWLCRLSPPVACASAGDTGPGTCRWHRFSLIGTSKGVSGPAGHL